MNKNGEVNPTTAPEADSAAMEEGEAPSVKDELLTMMLKIKTGSRSTSTNNAAVICNAFAHLCTGEKKFLKDNLEWVAEFIDWNKFDAVASLGVIHQGNDLHAKSILKAYLPNPAAPYEFGFMEGGALYAYGLVHCKSSQVEGVASIGTECVAQAIAYLKPFISRAELPEAIRHGACLGVALLGCGSGDAGLYADLLSALQSDMPLVGEAAAIAMGMVMAGCEVKMEDERQQEDGDVSQTATGPFNDMVQFMRETQHEKIRRGLRTALALLAYDRREGVERCVAGLIDESAEAALRQAGVSMLGMAYVGTGDASVVERLLKKTCSDPNDDVKRCATEALGFILAGDLELCRLHFPPLLDCFNGYVRYGAAMGLGIACATTGDEEVIALLKPLLTDKEPWVRQGAYIALGLVLNQRPPTQEEETRKRMLNTVIPKRSEPSVSKFGAILSLGLMNAGCRGARFSMFHRSNEGEKIVPEMRAVCGVQVFLQHWFWQPLIYFLSTAMEQSLPIDKSYGVESDAAVVMTIGETEPTLPSPFEFAIEAY